MDVMTDDVMKLQPVPVEIVSAVPLKQDQFAMLEVKLIKAIKKPVSIKSTIDKSLIGGLRIVVGTAVIDNSIKTQLTHIKEELYKGVFSRNES